jgi:hypothetical protein
VAATERRSISRCRALVPSMPDETKAKGAHPSDRPPPLSAPRVGSFIDQGVVHQLHSIARCLHRHWRDSAEHGGGRLMRRPVAGESRKGVVTPYLTTTSCPAGRTYQRRRVAGLGPWWATPVPPSLRSLTLVARRPRA